MLKRVTGNGRAAYVAEVKSLGFDICQCEEEGHKLPLPTYAPQSGIVGIFICSECGLPQWTLNYIYPCDECTEPVMCRSYPPVGELKHSDC